MKLFNQICVLGLSVALIGMPWETTSLPFSKAILQHKAAACLIGGLAITSSVLGYVVWHQHNLLKEANEELINDGSDAQDMVKHTRRQLEAEKKHLAEELEDAQKRIKNLQEDAELAKKCSEETVVCLNKERFKTGLIGFILKAYELKNSCTSLVGLAGQFKNQKNNGKPILEKSIREHLNNIERLKKDIADIEKPEIAEVDEVGGKTLLKLITVLRMRNPTQALADCVQTLTKSAQEINALIVACNFKPTVPTSPGSKGALESGTQENPALMFIRKNKGLPAHQILGVASDAMMPEIRKAYRSLSLQFHSDKAKREADKPDYEQAMKMLNDAQATMVRSFN